DGPLLINSICFFRIRIPLISTVSPYTTLFRSATKDVDLTMEEEEIKMQVPDDLLFDFDENKLKSEAKETLDEIIEDLSDLGSEVDIQINGHTDNQGDADYKITLSKERTEDVAEYFRNTSK